MGKRGRREEREGQEREGWKRKGRQWIQWMDGNMIGCWIKGDMRVVVRVKEKDL